MTDRDVRTAYGSWLGDYRAKFIPKYQEWSDETKRNQIMQETQDHFHDVKAWVDEVDALKWAYEKKAFGEGHIPAPHYAGINNKRFHAPFHRRLNFGLQAIQYFLHQQMFGKRK